MKKKILIIFIILLIGGIIMKAIKKVQVTPLDYNFGKIIDSASTTDDKTKNTYSMRVIDEKTDDKYEILTGSVTNTTGEAIEFINYPTGFTYQNSIVIGGSLGTMQIPCYVTNSAGNIQSSINIFLGDENIILIWKEETLPQTVDYKIVLMKIDAEVSPSV